MLKRIYVVERERKRESGELNDFWFMIGFSVYALFVTRRSVMNVCTCLCESACVWVECFVLPQ